MKMSVTLSKQEVQNAIEDYLKKQGFSKIINITLNTGDLYDPMDRRYGTGFIDAKADVEK